jgi:hypothetical protein
MAKPTNVNSQITDAVTQTNVKVLGEAPAMSIATVYQSAAHSLGLAFDNSVYSQQQANVTYQAAVTMCVQTLMKK